MADDIFTLDTDNNAAVRTISVKAGASETNSPVIFTKDADGNAAVRVMGGAGSIDEDRIIIKSAEIPAASEDELGKFYCYSGVTNQDFGHGYVYECVESGGIYTWARINLQPGSEHDLGFFDTVAELQTAHPTGIAGDFALIGATDTFWVWDTTTSAWVDSHKTDAVTSVNGQTGAVVLAPSDIGAATAAQGAKADTAIQSVKTINSQSIVGEGNLDIDALPSQTGHAGKVLTTDGTDASWETPTTITMRTWGANE